MLKHYLAVALRTLRRDRAYALLNVAGLAVGLACCLLIGLYVLAPGWASARLGEISGAAIRLTDRPHRDIVEHAVERLDASERARIQPAQAPAKRYRVSASPGLSNSSSSAVLKASKR